MRRGSRVNEEDRPSAFACAWRPCVGRVFSENRAEVGSNDEFYVAAKLFGKVEEPGGADAYRERGTPDRDRIEIDDLIVFK